MVLPGKVATEARKKFGDIIKRYMTGDASLVGEIEANAAASSLVALRDIEANAAASSLVALRIAGI